MKKIGIISYALALIATSWWVLYRYHPGNYDPHGLSRPGMAIDYRHFNWENEKQFIRDSWERGNYAYPLVYGLFYLLLAGTMAVPVGALIYFPLRWAVRLPMCLIR